MNINRKHFLRSIVAAIGVLALKPQQLIFANQNNSLTKLILKIGNTNGEKERAKLLEGALMSPDLINEEREVLGKLFFISDRWANGFEKYANPGSEGNEMSGYLCSFLNKCKIDRFFFPKLDDSDPFFPLIAFY